MSRLLCLAFLSLFISIPTFGATIMWGTDTSSFVDHTGSMISSGSAFLYMVNSASGYAPTYSNGAWDLSGATLIDSTSVSSGYVDSEVTVDYNTQYHPGENSGYFYVMIITSGTGDDLASLTEGWYFTTGELFLTNDGSPDPENPTRSEGSLWFTEDGTSGWLEMGGDTPIDPDVPEPTALALLALGVAGVALRRRVA